MQLNEAQDEILKKKELLEDLQPDNTQTCKCHIFQSNAMSLCNVNKPQQCLYENSFTEILIYFFVCLKALKVEEMAAALKKKEDDMRAMEERYKMYLEKARNVSDHYFSFRFLIVT